MKLDCACVDYRLLMFLNWHELPVEYVQYVRMTYRRANALCIITLVLCCVKRTFVSGYIW